MQLNKLRFGHNLLGKYFNYMPSNTSMRYRDIKSFNEVNSVNNHILNYLTNPVDIRSVVSYEKSNQKPFSIHSPLFKQAKIGNCYPTTKDSIEKSILNYKSRQMVSNLETRLNIFKTASDLIENKYYDKLLASIIVNQGKNLLEAELDATELIDFLRYNIYYTVQLYKKQPNSDIQDNIKNITEYLPLDGFVSAITPFNFSAIAGNLASSPMLFNNFVSWKPSQHSYLSNKLI